MEKDRDILLVSILTFITIFFWIFFELVKTSKTSTVSPATQKLLTPLETKIDNEILTILGERKVYR